MPPIETSKTHETRYAGTLTDEQVREILKAKLMEAAGVPSYESGVTLIIKPDPLDLGCAFELVVDHLDYLKKRDPPRDPRADLPQLA